MKLKSIRILLFILFVTPPVLAVENGEEVADKYKWNLSDIFKAREEFVLARESIRQTLPEVEKYKGRLGESPKVLKECLDSRVWSLPGKRET